MDQSSSSNAAPAVNPGQPAPGPQPAPGSQAAPGSQPAPATGNTPAPDSKSNEPAPAFSFESALSDEERSYLKSQGIESFDEEGIKKLVSNHKRLRGERKESNNQQPQSAGDINAAVQQAMGVQPQQTQSEPAPQPTQTQQPQQEPYQQPVQQPVQPQSITTAGPRVPSEFQTMVMGQSIKAQYPNVDPAEVIKKMGEFGISPVDPQTGEYRAGVIMSYAKEINEKVELQRQLAEAQKPAPSSTPDVKQENVDHSMPLAETLNSQNAQAIIVQSLARQKRGLPVHPQFEDAKRFIQGR